MSAIDSNGAVKLGGPLLFFPTAANAATIRAPAAARSCAQSKRIAADRGYEADGFVTF